LQYEKHDDSRISTDREISINQIREYENVADSISINCKSHSNQIITRMNNMRIMINARMMTMIEEAGRIRKRLSIGNVA
jgi:hypothetical protein